MEELIRVLFNEARFRMERMNAIASTMMNRRILNRPSLGGQDYKTIL